MKKLRFLPAARSEFLAEVKYYNEARLSLGRQFIDAVQVAIARAVKFPLAGTPSPKQTYRIFVKDFPFSVFYRQDRFSDGKTAIALLSLQSPTTPESRITGKTEARKVIESPPRITALS